MDRRLFLKFGTLVGGGFVTGCGPGAGPTTTKEGPVGDDAVDIISDGESGRVLVTDSLSYCDGRVGPRDVVVGASFAGAATVVVPLKLGVKAVIAHAAGVGKDAAGVSGLSLAQRFGVPAAAVDTMSARIADGRSLLAGTISHANDDALALGVRVGQPVAEAARLMLAAPAGKPVSIDGVADETIHLMTKGGGGGVYAVWSLPLVKGERPTDVFCVATHAGTTMAKNARKVMPKGVISNDAGMALDGSGIAGLAILDETGVPAAAVAAMSARIGDGVSTYRDGVISAANRAAGAKGVRVGMLASEAARLMVI